LLITQGRLGEAEQVLDLLKEEEYFDFIRRDDKKSSSLTGPIGLTPKEIVMHERYEGDEKAVTAAGRESEILSAIDHPTDEQARRLAEVNQILARARQEWSNFCHDANLEDHLPRGPDNSLKEIAGLIGETLRHLGAGTVALRTLVGDKTYRVILVTSMDSTPPIAREFPIGREELRRKVFAFRQALQDPAKDPRPLGQDLFRILIGPVAAELQAADATTLMWDLDDALRYLPIAALHDGQDYLVSRYRTEVFTPASIPRLLEPSEVKKWSGLGMGISKAYGDFRPLPSVPEELHRIIRDDDSPDAEGVLPGTTMLDENFTEDNMKRALKKKYR
jgi:CHAT domain-containing protein